MEFFLLIPIALLAYFCGMWRKMDVYEHEIKERKRVAEFWRELYEKAKSNTGDE